MRSPVLSLTWHLARSSGRRGLQGQVLAAAAAAVSALVLLVLLAAYLGSGARADRTAWLNPGPDRHGTAVQVVSTTFVRGEPVTVVDLAQLPGRAATPPPPGLDHFPKPGEVFLSPALSDLVHELPARQLADRFPKTSSYGTVGGAGLAASEQRLAVVGRAATDPAVSSSAAGQDVFDNGLAARAVVSGFSGTSPHVFTANDRTSALSAVGLLVVPVMVLAAASGRLGAARREQRLAGLRLAGATPRQILAMTGAEAAAVGATGAVAGALAYCALLPALARLPFGIGSWRTADLWVGVPVLLAVIAAVALLIALSAVTTLRQVARSPLGVAQQADPRRTRLIRLFLFVGLVFYVATTARSGSLTTSKQLALVVLFYAAFWIVGPWVVDRLGRLLGRFARRPATLLAARRLSDDPRGAWRTVSGLVLAGFVAGFFSVAHLNLDGLDYEGQIAVPVTAEDGKGSVRETAERARELLKDAGVTATVHAHTSEKDVDSLLFGTPGITARVSGGPDRFDAAVTALTGLGTATPPYTQEQSSVLDDLYVGELRGTGLAALALGFVVATASAGLTAAANVLDRRRVYNRLRLAGTPLKVLDRARVRETVVPLVVLAGGMTASGVYLATKLNEAFDTTVDTAGALQLAVCVLFGALVMFAAIGASRPLLRRVTADPAQQAD
ncbi:FtsX-like permease family protein [Streptomyces phyllanthi]|uniref:ABC transporter permease n=1 Tax=Streptomyces phyllanthi TaxID=1803180 RepID=A0A5N8WAB8_9ACTN|nr:FtsX-like permease family protein [Streptomyces phyllanthi]MPY43736.1 ABC transporter permease [Streptomyces phyllanthi]